MSSETSTNSLQPWQFFVLAALGCATAATFIVRSQGPMAVILLTTIIGTSALIGLAVLRLVRPLVSAPDDRSPVLGHRTRAGLEQEKLLALRTIKELEFDRAMGKLSEADFQEMSTRLRARAARLIRQLDAGGDYRSRIEKELASRLGDGQGDVPDLGSACGRCSTVNESDARFCKECGARL
jgi:hypothetical protein